MQMRLLITPWSHVKGKSDDLEYDLTYELIARAATTMRFRINGRVGTVEIKNVDMVVPRKLNEPVEITDMHVQGGPRFFAVVIAVPSQNFAMVALGPKEDPDLLARLLKRLSHIDLTDL
jgi:hypothetical protein